MTKVKKNILVNSEIMEKKFPKIMEAIQLRTDTMMESFDLPTRKIKETDVWDFVLSEAYESLVEQGLIDREPETEV